MIHVIIFSNRTKSIYVSLNNEVTRINRVKEIKLLGPIIDENLSWKSHINGIKLKIAKTITVLHKVKDSLENKSQTTSLIHYIINVYSTTFRMLIIMVS